MLAASNVPVGLDCCNQYNSPASVELPLLYRVDPDDPQRQVWTLKRTLESSDTRGAQPETQSIDLAQGPVTADPVDLGNGSRPGVCSLWLPPLGLLPRLDPYLGVSNH